MKDDELAHLCHLASITVDMVRHPDFDVADIVPPGDEPQNYLNMFLILADAFVELQARAGMKHKFRIPARTA